MALRNLHHLFEPTTVAVIGATERPGSVGQIVLSNLLEGPTLKGVFPVNPKRDKLLGAKAFKSIGDVPVVPDLAVVCTPAATVPDVVAQCAAKGIKGVIVLSAGFREIGEAGMALDAQLEKVIRDAGDMRVMGPNCLGAILPHLKLNVSFASGMPAPGQVAFISQSGALCTSVLDWAAERNIGFSHFVSMGNMMNVTFADMLDYVGTSAHTRSVILYIESIPDARAFVSAARAFSRTKPIIAYKAGRFAASAEAAASHTGALAGEDAVYDAAFRRAGIERVFEVDEMFACAELLGRQSTVPGERLTIVTNAGGPGVMASDTLLAHDGVLAELTPATVEKLNGQLPPFWSHANPIDVLGDAGADRYQTAIAAALADANTDAVLVILTPQAMTDATGTAQAVVDASKANRGNRKPIITAWMGGPSVREGAALLKAAGIPNYATPERAINAHMHLVSTARNRELLHETPRELPPLFDVQLTTRRTDSHRLLGDAPGTLSEADAKKLLDAYGIPVTLPHPATTADQAVTAARRVGYPVVLKVDVDGITHKTDVGGVELNLLDEEDVRTAFDRIEKRVRHHMGERPVNMGVTVQKMIHAEHALELIVGAKRDPVFGSVLLLGTGGVATEVFADSRLALPPLNANLAKRLVTRLRSWPIIAGHRGRAPLAVDKLVELLIRMSYLVADHGRITELDANPVLLTPDTAIALDARVMVDGPMQVSEKDPYPHLTIRPVPEKYRKSVRLKDGTPVTLRPLTPEDEPKWHAMLGTCSEQTIRQRFFATIKSFTHEMAARYCFIDYDRELAIVAEFEKPGGGSELLGVGRLSADPDRSTAEFAVLVADPWQRKGLGLLLTDYCLGIANDWGVPYITSVTTSDNDGMRAIYDEFGFETKLDEANQLLTAEKRV